MESQGLGKGTSILDHERERLDDALQRTVFRLLLQSPQSPEQGHAGLDKGCQLAGKDREAHSPYAPTPHRN